VSVDCIYAGLPVITSTCTPGLIGPGHAVQFAIHVKFASSDLTLFPAGYTPGGIGATGAVAAAAFTEHIPGSAISTPIASGSNTSPGGQTSSAASQNNVGSSLSTGAKAGIGVGSTVVVLAILAGFFVLFRRRRKSAKESGGPAVPEDDRAYNDKEVVTTEQPFQPVHKPYHSELDGQLSPKSELPGFQEQNLHELPHDQTKSPFVQELNLPIVSRNSFQKAPADYNMSATAYEPVSAQLDNTPDGSTGDRLRQPQDSIGPQLDQSISSPLTVEDVELRYLEDEEKRIRGRKEAILASRRP